jgi:hypothetical protein
MQETMCMDILIPCSVKPKLIKVPLLVMLSLAQPGFPECADCYKLLHQFWCAQTVPTCGIFDKVIDEILPLISLVALRKEKPSVALQEAVPRMLQAASLGLPCREMCDTITQTCGCGKPTTFGQAMMSIQTGKHQEMYNTNMSVSTAKDIFAKIWDKPVCDLFVESDMPGFSGVCTVQESSGSCSWCSGKSAQPGIVDEQIVAQTAQWFSGLMQVIESNPFSYLELIANTRIEIFLYSFLIYSQTL